jgi:uncharacterized protein YndB with AHSA1/START domain
MAPSAKLAAAEIENAPELTLTRKLDASPGAVFRAWTDPALLARWMGPRSVKAEVASMDVRVGGSYRIVMHLSSGGTRTVRGVYQELRPAERLVFTWAWDDDSGKPGHETQVTITLRAIGKQTEMTIHHVRFADATSRDSHNHGWNGSFDKLAEALAAEAA